ncbi:MAG: carbamoyltransferase HypF [Thermoguttaceae bacterium]
MNLPRSPSPVRRVAITVRGVVQGVGFRPFVYNAARSRGLAGWVRNEADTVRIEAQGDSAAVDAFIETLRHDLPPQARIDAMEVDELSPLPLGERPGVESGQSAIARPRPTAHPPLPTAHCLLPTDFEIRPSEGRSAPRPTIPADLATCRECQAEIFDPTQRRFGYPFTNCTNCGPRWSIIEQLPYDRPRTSMASFTMCPACQAEYEDPADRRFHAQPIACPRCGPTLQLLDRAGRELSAGRVAMEAAANALLAGQIVALKGLGGFQLLVDATNADAIERLRQRKHRPDRPFAIMVPSLDDARAYCVVSDDEAKLMTSHQSPIVLLRRLAPSPLSPLPSPLNIVPGVAPDNPYLGVMLPYTPLHHLLMAAVRRPVVCTSGNLSEEPMAIDTDDALKRLGPIADVLLTHNRPIVRPVDDSIVRVGPDGPQVLRRARGFAPLPISLQGFGESPPVLAVGGHLKNTVALALGAAPAAHPSPLPERRVRACTHASSPHPSPLPMGEGTEERTVRATTHPAEVVISAHIGDLDSVASVGVFRRAIDDLVAFFQTTPAVVVCDLHPDYASTQHAEKLASRWNVPLVRVQHHHAHVAACMAEHGLAGPVLGFSWDGTGYGPDGTVWGGETLVCRGAEYRRVAHLRTFALPGGDQAIREPRRSALGLLFEFLGPTAADVATPWFSEQELTGLLAMLDRGMQSPRTSSMGRLFDAVAAICGLPADRGIITFEGQAAMALEFAADESEASSYPFAKLDTEGGCTVLDWEPMIRELLADRAAGVFIGTITARFHNALADMALAVAQSQPSQLPVMLTGGCFQNRLLADRVRRRLSDAGFDVYTQRMTPPGDGGISLGQVFVALQQICRLENRSGGC